MSEWVGTTLGEITSFASGHAFAPTLQGKAGGKYPFYKVSDMNDPANAIAMRVAANWVDAPDIKAMRARVWPAGTVVFPKVGAALLTEKRRILTRESAFDNNIMGLIAGPRLLPSFLLELMKTVRLGNFVQQGAVPSVNQSHVAAVRVSLPSNAEQARIVAVLSTADALIQALDTEQRTALRLRSNLLLSSLAAGNRQIRRLGDIVSLDVETVNVIKTNKYPIVGVLNYGRGLLYRRALPGSATSYRTLNLIRPNQIVYSRLKAFEGAITVIPETIGRAYASSEFPTFTCGDELVPGYFALLTTTQEMWATLQNLSTGMGGRRERVKPSAFLEMKVRLPSVAEQVEIVERVGSVSRTISQVASELAALRVVRADLLTALLSQEITVDQAVDKFVKAA